MFRSLKRALHRYVLPHESNNFRAKALHHSHLLVYIFAIAVLQMVPFSKLPSGPGILGYATNISVERIVSLVNQERLQAGLPPVTISEELTTAANQKAADMYRNNYWAHVSPSGVTPWYFIKEAGYEYVYAGENLAKSFNSSDEVVRAWMNSPTHRANILKPEYKEMGIAIMNGSLIGEETTLVVQEFGSRSIEPVQVANNDTPPIRTENPSGELANVPGLSAAQVLPQSIGLPKISNPFKFLTIVVAEILLFILAIDSVYIWKYRTLRLHGNSVAHIIFLAALLGAMGATGIGVIL